MTAWLYDSSNGDITTTVNVGIGTTSPDYEFELEMNQAATLSLNVQNLNNTQISRLMIQNDGGSAKSSDYRIYGSASAATLAGIAVADWAVLVQQSNLSGFMIYNTSTDPIVFCTNATERMRVDGTTGYVGIGDTTPDATLDVSETDAVTNAITDIAILEHLTSGTAAANFGAGLLYQLEDAGGTSRNAMRQAVVWQSAAAAENAEFQLYLNYNGTLYDCGVLVGPGAASFAGNQRGIGAVDWQGYRSAAADVASGAYSVISGGAYNAATQSYSAALSGYDNLAAAQYSIVCGGSGNSANPGTGYAFTGGGLSNTASGDYATVGGGDTNTSSGSHAAICGGDTNTASGTASTVGGGISNLASNLYATIPGGYSCIASGSVSYAGGYDAHATHDYSMVFSATNANTVSWAASTFTARCHGGARFYSAAGVGTGVQLAAGASAWAAISDRATKENFVPVGAEILDLVLALPLYNYNLKSQDESIRHIGPVAQDFNSIFGFTEAELYINTFDATGVALAAAKQLILENRELRSRIANLEALWQHSH